MADVLVVGGKSQTDEIRVLIDSYNQLDSEKDKDLKEAIKAFIMKKIEDENARTKRAEQVISWTNNSGKTTFWFSHILLVFGLLAAAVEMLHAWRLRSRNKRDSIEVEISLEKIALKSTMYGILLLFASLLFYFIYIKYVYPPTYVMAEQSQATSTMQPRLKDTLPTEGLGSR
jgi:hypothetical protein